MLKLIGWCPHVAIEFTGDAVVLINDTLCEILMCQLSQSFIDHLESVQPGITSGFMIDLTTSLEIDTGSIGKVIDAHFSHGSGQGFQIESHVLLYLKFTVSTDT
jgi:hypothetical protein